MATGLLYSHSPTTVETLLTTTRDAVLKSKEYLNDAIFTKSTLLSHLNRNSKVTKQGGASILVPLMYAKNSTFKAYNGDDVLDTSGMEGLTLAQATWRNYGGTIKYTGEEIRQNGAEKLADLAKAKIKQASMSARDKLNSDFFASSQAAKAVHCLPILIDATSTVQSINSTTYSWWQAQVNASVGSFATNGLDKLRDTRDDISLQGQEGASLPDFYVTTQLIKELYESSQVASLRYKKGDKLDPSQESMVFAGAPVEIDPNCATGELYCLSSDALEFVVHSMADWEMSEFQKPPTQDVYIAQLIWMGNLVVSNRRRLGKLTGITA